MSLFWSNPGWGGDKFYNSSVVNNLADGWSATIIRAAMGVESGGYLSSPDSEKAKVKTVVDAAIAKGIYVLIDWHYSSAAIYTDQAKAFFKEMAQTYGSQPNVIYEIFNEPTSVAWGDLKTYAEAVIGEIRGAGSQNLVVVGTPTWSQDVDLAAANPVTKYGNVAYTLHFYAGTHKQSLRDKASAAMAKGIALFVTEWGTCDASGNGGLDLNESQTWIDFMNQNKLSWCNWSLNDKAETASALVSGASTTGPWADSQLTESGKFVKKAMQTGASSSSSVSSAVSSSSSSAQSQTPYSGSPVSLPGTVEAENFDNGGEGVAYHDADTVNSGGAYRSTGVDLEACGEGGYNVGWTASGEWLEYTVNVSQNGNYKIEARVASTVAGRTFHIEFDGVNKTGTMTVPNTGAWQTYQTVTANVALSAGTQVMKIVFDGDSENINWVKASLISSSSSSVSSSSSSSIASSSSSSVEVAG